MMRSARQGSQLDGWITSRASMLLLAIGHVFLEGARADLLEGSCPCGPEIVDQQLAITVRMGNSRRRGAGFLTPRSLGMDMIEGASVSSIVLTGLVGSSA